jgi:hypothetical protein
MEEKEGSEKEVEVKESRVAAEMWEEKEASANTELPDTPIPVALICPLEMLPAVRRDEMVREPVTDPPPTRGM